MKEALAKQYPGETHRRYSAPETELFQQMKVAGIPIPCRELRVVPDRLWRFDFAWPDKKIAVEVHGGVYAAGRHVRGTGFTEDRRKMNAAVLAGWRVFEFTTEQIKRGEALALLDDLF